jgi:sigma-B regulation protein RsbU (phosphoserine phosphatase)
VAVWLLPSRDGPLVAGPAAPPDATAPPLDLLPDLGRAAPLGTGSGSAVVVAIPGPQRAWMTLGPCSPGQPPETFARFLLPVVTQMLQSSLEVEHAARELAERYEEINLLYTTSEILGRTVALEEAAAIILTEISETVGARRGAILVHDRVTGTLQAEAALGVSPIDTLPIGVDDECSVSALVYREKHAMIVEGKDMPCEAEAVYRRGAMLSVPIMWTGPEGNEPLGVVNLSDRRSGQPFTAGDQKLVAAIATQIGTAIQNTRLVRASLAQQRLVQEMQLAHDLQMKLLPGVDVVAPDAEVAARVVPAESVGGDFYHLFRLGAGRTGVMIGDVSNHGYRAALIMALAMSAAAIHAQATADPGPTLGAVLGSLRDELNTTEMFITLFYAVIDRERGVLHYANTGHPHAFIVSADGTLERLPALDPPLGMVDAAPGGATRPWAQGKDLLLLFTDGVSDAPDRAGRRLGEQPVLDIVREHRAEPAAEIVERVFATLRQHTGDAPLRDDLTLVVVRS